MESERNLKRLRKLFGVSQTILKRAARCHSIGEQDNEDDQRLRFQLLKEMRQKRISTLGANHRYVLDLCADMLQLDTEEVISGIVDDTEYVENLNAIFEANGLMAIMISNAKLMGYPIDSGRYEDSLRHTEIYRTICLTPRNVKLIGKYVVVYRQKCNKPIENKVASEEIGFFMINADGPYSCLSVVKTMLEQVLKPSFDAVEDYGFVEKQQLQKFSHVLSMYHTFLRSSDAILSKIHFNVSNELYKGLLLVKWQIKASSKIANRVKLVERYFESWLNQIQEILVESKQIQRDPPDVGPINMLFNWRNMLATLTSITEFVTSRAFNNHKYCLTISRSSKLLNRWTKLDSQVTLALNEAKDNVRFISSLQKFWNPFYRVPKLN